MINKIMPALAIAGSIGFLSLGAIPSATAQNEPTYQQAMAAANFTLWNSGESRNVAFNVWKRSARLGGGFYYFMWRAPYASVEDRGEPEVVVFFDSSLVQLNSQFLVDCYKNGSYGNSTCDNPDNKPTHYRWTGVSAEEALQLVNAISD